jgi:hypothetical protein
VRGHDDHLGAVYDDDAGRVYGRVPVLLRPDHCRVEAAHERLHAGVPVFGPDLRVQCIDEPVRDGDATVCRAVPVVYRRLRVQLDRIKLGAGVEHVRWNERPELYL